MAEFDELTSDVVETEKSDEQNTNRQEDDLFGSDFTTNTTTGSSYNPFSSDVQQQQQQPDLSWAIDDDLNSTTTTASAGGTVLQSNIFDDNNLENFTSAPQTATFDNDIFTIQTNTDEFNSYSTTNLASASDDLVYNNADRRPSENSLSYNMFANSVPSSTSLSTNTNQIYSRENLDAIQAVNARRQQEIAEMDAIEKQKIEELRQQAKKDLERWYADRRSQMEHKRQSIKQEEDLTVTQALEKSDNKSCDWAKVLRYLEFSQGTQLTKQKRDLNRMRAVMIQAKRDRAGQKSENGV